jgi:hypothetical protein
MLAKRPPGIAFQQRRGVAVLEIAAAPITAPV